MLTSLFLQRITRFIVKRPWLSAMVTSFFVAVFRRTFTNSTDYWCDRYRRGGISGDGSLGRLADFKAKVINQYLDKLQITSVVDWGCGDGSQLAMLRVPHYNGLDVSEVAVQKCRDKFAADSSKTFHVMRAHFGEFPESITADLSLSADVIYHLVEDDIFDNYLRCVFRSATRFVLIYSTDTDVSSTVLPHVRHRAFTAIVRARYPDWVLIESIPNPFPFDARAPEQTSNAAFFLFGKASEHEPSFKVHNA
jgi:cyclopropane fatty-acyl-phospholipid synthase-like methyltransferase